MEFRLLKNCQTMQQQVRKTSEMFQTDQNTSGIKKRFLMLRVNNKCTTVCLKMPQNKLDKIKLTE